MARMYRSTVDTFPNVRFLLVVASLHCMQLPFSLICVFRSAKLTLRYHA